jgi:hypothetical protein
MHPEGPATGHLDTGFLGFPLSLKQNAEMVPKFQVATACFSCSHPDFKLIKITPFCGCHPFVFQIIDKTIRNLKFRCLKPPPITITSSLSYYSYHKDERT